jgi:hypothetical protein
MVLMAKEPQRSVVQVKPEAAAAENGEKYREKRCAWKSQHLLQNMSCSGRSAARQGSITFKVNPGDSRPEKVLSLPTQI